jgi:acyl-CoA synthetase (AMP-forming)/AMP-acid ligase II
VVTEGDAPVSAEALRTHLLAYVPKWWLPDAIAFAKDLPHGPTGKLQKDVLRRQVAGETGGLSEILCVRFDQSHPPLGD